MAEHAKTTKEFDIETILSLTTGYFICKDIMHIHKLVEYLYGELFYTLALGVAQEETGKFLCSKYLNINSLTEQYLTWYNNQDWDKVKKVEKRTEMVNKYVSKLKGQYGDSIELEPMTEDECYDIYVKIKTATIKK